jgi:hypothetical protein
MVTPVDVCQHRPTGAFIRLRAIALVQVRGRRCGTRWPRAGTGWRSSSVMARVDHPNVVKVYGVIPSGRWPQIVMQYVPSRSLFGVIRVDGPLAPPYVARLGLSLVDALSAIHHAAALP